MSKHCWGSALLLAALACGQQASKGDCPLTCGADQVCVSGQCLSACAAAGGTECGSTCVNTQSDDLNCGACGVACPPGQACSGATCAPTCSVGFSVCVTDAGAYCADLALDTANCGGCGNTCAVGNACTEGACHALGPCPPGQTLCESDAGGACVDVQSDANDCGACGRSCDVGQTCLAGGCVANLSCPAGFGLCATDAGSLCRDLQADTDNCGTCNQSCGANAFCTDGACGCQGLFTQCGSPQAPNCTDLNTDLKNCSACGQVCVACEICTQACDADDPFTAGPLLGASFGGALSAAVADFNGDGLDDVVVVFTSDAGQLPGGGQSDEAVFGDSVQIFFGDGGGGFPHSMTLTTDAGSFWLTAAGDINGDHLPDLVVTTSSGFLVFLGSADAGFVAAGSYQPPGYGRADGGYIAFQLVLFDLNLDGLADVLLADPLNGFDVFYARGDGGFDEANGIGPYYGWPFAVGDLNGDGLPDLAFGFYTYDTVVLFQQSDGGWSQPALVNGWGFPFIASEVLGIQETFLDFNNQITYGFSADAGFSQLSSFPGVSTGLPLVGDLNGDGIPDVLNPGPLVAFGHGKGLFGGASLLSAPFTYFSGPSFEPSPVALGDFNGDGRPDVVVTGAASGYFGGQYDGPASIGPGAVVLFNGCGE